MSKKKANENELSVRKDMRIEKDLLARVDAARGDTPFAAWVKRAILMRLDGADAAEFVQEKPVKTKQVQPSADSKKPSSNKSNAARALEAKNKCLNAAKSLTPEQKNEILNATHPMAEFRKLNGFTDGQKRTVSKAWTEIEVILKTV